MYSISIGLSSKNVGIFGVLLVTSIYYTWAFGTVSAQPNVSIPDEFLVRIAILIALLGYIGERYNTHVIDQTPYPPWLR